MKLLIDENLPARWCEYLEAAGFPAIHWTQVGPFGAPDDQIFDYAVRRGLVIVTQDLDFTRLLALRKATLPSVVQLRVSSPIPEVVGEGLTRVLQAHADRIALGCLVSLDLQSSRVRLLPLRT